MTAISPRSDTIRHVTRTIVRQKNVRRSAFNMLETVVSITLVSLLLVGSLNTLAFSTATTARDLDGLRALGLAEQLFSEISALNYTDPIETTTTFGREPGETSTTVRTDWDDVDDYNGLKESTLRYRDGTAIPGVTGWSRQVTVTGVVPSTLASSTYITGPLRLVTIIMEKSGGRTYTFRFFVSRDGFRTPPSLAPTIQPNYETQWQLGNRNYYWGVPLRNMPPPTIDSAIPAPPPKAL
ncbi:MAG: hypothetical protein J0M26_16910 [Planctomycetes bacterium]|nr:hypothetical protein [Planctomycetota bacterium]